MNKQKMQLLASAVILILEEEDFEENTPKAYWTHPLYLTRPSEGIFVKLNTILRNDESKFRNFVRMTPSQFDRLVEWVGPIITKADTNYRKTIGPDERLAVTLRYLASGESMKSLSYAFRMSPAVISEIIPEACAAICQVLKDNYMCIPNTKEKWEAISEEFNARWNFPNCIGAIDDKHIIIQAPNNCGSEYFNYKGTNSLVLMAMVDGNYRFTYVDVGAYGRDSDGGVFARCQLAIALRENKLNIPPPKALLGQTVPSPYVVVADDAFPLKSYIMKPFPFRNMNHHQRIYNYRLSRARRIVENVFGMCAARFRILRRPIDLHPDKATSIVMAICSLHNFLINENIINRGSKMKFEDDGFTWPPITTQPSGRNDSAQEIRKTFMDYFSSEEGSVPWQNSKV